MCARLSGFPGAGALLPLGVALPCDTSESVTSATPRTRSAATLPPNASVPIRIDAAGETPLVGEDEALCPGPDVRWRHVADVESREQGEALVVRLKRRPEFWNPRAASASKGRPARL